jgi:glycosyltransferase involved in cell wall biosynthesis
LTDAHAEGVRIGIVIPAFNAARWIGTAIASVLAQTHTGWSLVVVDDGSIDDTADVVGGFHDPRIRLMRQANRGVSAARNAGFDVLSPDTKDAVLFLDADDWLACDALSRLAAAVKASPAAVAASGACSFADIGLVRCPPSGDLLRRLLVRNLFANGGHVLLRTPAVRAAGGFLPGLAYGEDWEFWIRIALQGRFASVPDNAPVLFVRRHGEGAYRRLAADADAFAPCMDAIFANPALQARFGAKRLATIRRHTGAENDWIIGREQIRHGCRASGLGRLRRSVRRHPTPRRALLLAAAHVTPLLPTAWRGPLRPYRA